MQPNAITGTEHDIAVTAGVTASSSSLLMLFQHRNSRAVSTT
jgi:hypothetical protein